MIKQSTYAWDLMQALEPVSSTSCKTPTTFIDSICPNTQPGKKTEDREMRSNFQQIVGLHTQNSGLREMDLELSPKRGCDKSNMLKQGRNTQKKASRIVLPGITHGSEHLER